MRGHGAPGLLENLRTFSDLIDDSGANRRPYLGYFPGIQVTGWVVDSGRTYVARAHYVFDGWLRDIMAVQTDVGNLTRVETLAECRSTAGTYFADIDGARIASPYWDDGVTTWDGSALWDQSPPLDLYVHLIGDADPNGVTVVALLSFFFATKGEIHPVGGLDKLTNGDSDTVVWGTLLEGGAGLTAALDTVTFKSGIASTKLANDGSTAGTVSLREDVTLDPGLQGVRGSRYVLSGYYRTDPAFSPNLSARLWVGTPSLNASLDSGGRDLDSTGSAFLQLTPTNGEWRAFWFDFMLPALSTVRIIARLAAPGGAGAGQFNIDRFSLRRIYRYVYWEPRLGSGSLPVTEVMSQSIAFGEKTIGLGDFTLMNGDGVLNPIFGQLLLHGKPAATYVGGSLTDGQEVNILDWRAAWLGYTKKVTATDESISVQAEDARSLVNANLPPRNLSIVDYTLARKDDDGKGRYIVFNQSSDRVSHSPLRLTKTSNDYGVYEVADGALSLNGLDPLGMRVYTLPSEELAKKFWRNIPGFGSTPIDQAFLLVAGTHYTFDAALGQITIIDDVRNYAMDRAGNPLWPAANFDFNIGGGALVANLGGVNLYLSASQLAATLQASMRAVAGVADINVTYSHTTHKFIVSKGAGTLNLLPNTGANKANQAWLVFCGFKTDADKTASLAYTSDIVQLNDCDVDHVVRVAPRGFIDDAAGKITGTPNRLIQRHAEAAFYVLTQYLGVPLAQIDVASFRAGAAAELAGSSPALQAVIGGRDSVTVSEFFRRCQIGAKFADLVVGPDGVWKWRQYSAAGAAAQSFFDRDFLSFSITKDPENIAKAVRLRYFADPGTDSVATYDSAQDPGVLVKHGQQKVEEFDAYVASGPLLAQSLSRLLAANPRVVEFQSRGKLVDLTIGDRIAITRSRALDPTGALAATVFRIIGLSHDFIAGVSTCTAVENVAF